MKRLLARQLRDPVYANGYALVLNAGLASALGFAFWFVAARRVAAEDLGWGAAVVSAATLAALLGKAGFDAAIIRFGPTARDRVLRKLLVYATLASVALTACVGLAILWSAGHGVTSLSGLTSPRVAVGFLALACGTTAAWVLDAFFIAEQTAVLTLARNTAFNVVKLAAPFAIATGFAAFAVPLSWGAGLAASLVVAVSLLPWSFRRRTLSQDASPSRREVALYAAKNYALNVSEFLPGLLLPLVVLQTLGAEVNARFFMAWTIATVGFLASKAIAQSAFAQLVREGPARDAILKGAGVSAIVLVPFTLALLAGSEIVLALLQVAAPEPALLLRLLALSIAPIAASNLFLAYLKARLSGWELTVIPTLGLVAFLALVPVALARGGLVGIGALWLLVQATLGTYATFRLVNILQRSPHATPPNPSLRGRAHQG